MTLSCDAPVPGGLGLPIPPETVYRPQEDSQLLVDAVRRSCRVPGTRAADLCTGTGVVAIELARLGAASVLAIDSCPGAAQSAAARCQKVSDIVTVEHRDLNDLTGRDTFDLVTCNPPYVPTPPDLDVTDEYAWPRNAWDGGPDGRSVLDPLCAGAAELLNPGGTLLLVQSEFADPAETVAALRRTGLHADVVARRRVPFGPVLTAQATWFEDLGLLETDRRVEELVVIRADRPSTSAAPRGHR
ncbi:HemK2/MTQ2 family protein methyltransferase [Gordonia sp. DT101]|uniref:HemK2/MTQ2 family protein methyltransferase n=1 Tax=Gordonia sp. DT101 TaxID=3416545 RepID=UPI003CF16741